MTSPHVTIYKFPVTALSSITNRITGLALSGAFVGTGIASLHFPKTLERVENEYHAFEKFPKFCANSVISFPVIYHTLGGIRHFVWDAYPHLITNKSSRYSSLLLFGSSVVGSVIVSGVLTKEKNQL